MDSTFKTPEQLEQLINSSNETHNLHLEYYKKILQSCIDDRSFQEMLNSIKFKEANPLPGNGSMYRLTVKCYDNTSNIFVGPINDALPTELAELYALAIPMSHYHLSKNNYVQDNFIHRISDNENEPIKKFVERIKNIDSHIKMLIAEYIKNIDAKSPLANMLQKNNVSFNKNWIYNGIINESNGTEYLNLRFFKDSFDKRSKLGTAIYNGSKRFGELEDLLSRNTYSYVNGKIYPLFKVSYVLVNERFINGQRVVAFTCKAYFVDMLFSQNTVKCSTKPK
jgi:hypothetical protein